MEDQKPLTIDLTPTWPAVLPILLAALEDGTEEGKRMAREELKRMAQVAEAAKSAIDQRAALMASVRSLVEVVRRGPDQVIGYDRGGQRQQDFSKGWNAAKDQVWTAIESMRNAAGIEG